MLATLCPPPFVSKIALGRRPLFTAHYRVTKPHFDYGTPRIPHALGPMARRIYNVSLREPEARTNRFVLDFVSVPLRHKALRALCSPGEICCLFCIDFFKKLSLGESSAQTDRVVNDFVLFSLRKPNWRAPSSDGQICN